MTTATATSENRWGAKDGKDAQDPGGGQGSKSKGADKKGKKEKKKGSLFKSKKFIIIVVAVLGVGGGAYKFLVPSKPAPVVGGIVVPIDATTINLTDGHYLKIAVGVQLVEGKGAEGDVVATSHASELIIDEFANRSVASLSSNAARKRLTAELVEKVKKAYEGEVFDVFVTQFVTQ
jgi:flagellar protein FliL